MPLFVLTGPIVDLRFVVCEICHTLMQYFWFYDDKFSYEFWYENYGCVWCLIAWFVMLV